MSLKQSEKIVKPYFPNFKT